MSKSTEHDTISAQIELTLANTELVREQAAMLRAERAFKYGSPSEPQRPADTAVVVPIAGDIPAHQQRVLDEKRELDDRLAKLIAFVRGPVFPGLGEAERERLRAQELVMVRYSAILGERIAAFKAPEA